MDYRLNIELFLKQIKKPSLVKKGCAKLIGNGHSTSFWFDTWIGDKPIAEVCNFEVPLHSRDDKVGDYFNNSGSWDWNRLSFLSQDVLDQISLVQLDSRRDDRSIWASTTKGDFTVHSAYTILLPESVSNFTWNKIWKLVTPPRIQHFLWLVSHNRILTREACFNKGISATSFCPRCNTSVENVLHVLRDCNSSHFIWTRWLNSSRLDYFNSLSLHDWLLFNLSNQNSLVADVVPWPIWFSFTCWNIWKWRNKVLFEDGFSWPVNGATLILFEIHDFLKYTVKNISRTPRHIQHIAWQYPPQGFVKVNVDASAKSNPGDLAIGGLCRDACGAWLFGFTRKVGRGCIIKAEVFAILTGLQLAWDHGCRCVIVESDSVCCAKSSTTVARI
ncbi:hypothetical protein REPUB_Repub08aG0116500 [Reevesia pubescens]